MAKPFLAVAIVLILALIGTARAAAPDVLGDWTRDDGGTRLRIAACGADLCATNTWVKDPKGDEHVGDLLVMKLAPKPGGKLEGTADDKRRDATYDLTLTVSGPKMQSHGCAVIGLVCKDADWTRS